jgi:hypothetical protein
MGIAALHPSYELMSASAEFQDCLAGFVQALICTRKRHKVSDI